MRVESLRAIRWWRILPLGIITCVLACGVPERDIDPTVILISFDGFRSDYPEKAETPNLDLLASQGVRAEGLIPIFPSKTFPNHYTLVTGLYAEHHGIVANNMQDPDTGERFSLDDRTQVENGRWWGGEPIWVTLAKQGKKSATLFWPGSEAEIQGHRPDYWRRFDGKVSYHDRVEQALAWLDLPESERPAFISLYFSASDNAGHEYGPDSKETREAIERLDATLGELLAGLRSRGLFDSVNLIVVSDHGMAGCDPSRVVFLDDCLDLRRANLIDWNPVAAMRPAETDRESVFHALDGCNPHLKVYRKEQLPERFHYRDNPRIPPIIAIADEGWVIDSHSHFDKEGGHVALGNHGYDNQLKSMWGIFFAHGPAFPRGERIAPLPNVDVYPLMARILGVEAARNDGDPATVEAILKR